MSDALAATRTLPALASVAQVADLLGLDASTVRKYVTSGRLPALKLGRNRAAPIRIPRAAVARFLERHVLEPMERDQ